MGYAEAYEIQTQHLDAVVASRESDTPSRGVILLVEHPAVITVSRRGEAAGHVLATPETLARAGVELAQTDRGGDVTYHGPGQLVVYPIIDLNAHSLRIVDHIRLLEGAIIDALATFGVVAMADPTATGVWTPDPDAPPSGAGAPLAPHAKVAAIGVRVKRWVSMHGLAINVDPDLDHFGLIVPCGLHGRPVTSLRRLLGERCPTMSDVKAAIVAALRARFDARAAGRVGGGGRIMATPAGIAPPPLTLPARTPPESPA